MNTTHYLACDLGSEQGRIVLGSLTKGHLTLEEIHVFPATKHEVEGELCWDLAALEHEIFTGIQKAARRELPISGLSATSSGVDYVLLDRDQSPLRSPACDGHRPNVNETARLSQKLPLATHYAETGTPLPSFPTLLRLEADHQADPELFQRAERMLPLADYLNARFSGTIACEESLASTTQLFNPQTHAWSAKVMAALDLRASLLPRLVPGGTAFGPVIERLRKSPGMLTTRVVATSSHSTGAAVTAVPARPEQRWAYLHSDLWSQFGVELNAPILSTQARENGFTNEAGLGGSIRLLKESIGLALVRECQGAWALAGETYSEAELIDLAADAGPAEAHIEIDDPRFREPGDMPEMIAAACREKGLPAPKTPGQTIRVVLESMALAHGETLRQLEALTGREIEVIHVVGRGSRYDLLNQLTADVTGLPVVVGPADATAIGNILIQALALWHLTSPDHLRSLVSTSFPTRVLTPRSAFDGGTARARPASLSQREAALA
jgi:rhamnulokinase